MIIFSISADEIDEYLDDLHEEKRLSYWEYKS